MDKATSDRLKHARHLSNLKTLVMDMGLETIEYVFEQARVHAVLDRNIAPEMASDDDVLEYIEKHALGALCAIDADKRIDRPER